MNEKQSLIYLNMIEGLGPLSIKRLVERFGSAKKSLEVSPSEWCCIPRMPAKIIQSFEAKTYQKAFEDELKRIEQLALNIITWDEEQYPQLLKQIYDPPPILYIKGQLPEQLDISIGIVGSRYATSAGLGFAKRIAGELASKGIPVVSGLAKGIDRAAHEGVVAVHATTIAVLGSGLANIYPKGHIQLVEKIVESKGAVISEFPLTIEPMRYNFPRRNRIISGLSRGVIVVEAAKRSGSLITARYALEQNREVYAVPGVPGTVSAMGTNHLIQQGAKLITSAEDVLEDLYPLLKEHIEEKKQLQISNPRLQIQAKDTCAISEEAQKLLQLIDSKKMHFDEIVHAMDIVPNKLSLLLLSLNLKKHVKKIPGNYYEKIVHGPQTTVHR